MEKVPGSVALVVLAQVLVLPKVLVVVGVLELVLLVVLV